MPATRSLLHGPVSVVEYRCDAGPHDPPFWEPHEAWSVSYVRCGSFGCRCQGRHFELVPGSVLVGRPGDEYQCTHDHHLGASGEGYAGFGTLGAPALWLYAQPGGVGPGVHLAFRAADRAAVQRFHAQGLKAGGRDNGAPGLRADYSPTYYAAFLLDPDGHNVEAVCFS